MTRSKRESERPWNRFIRGRWVFLSLMAQLDKGNTATLEELLVSSLAQTDALAKLLIEKGLITREEFMQKVSKESGTYQKLLKSS
jgi:hypothetical protein